MIDRPVSVMVAPPRPGGDRDRPQPRSDKKGFGSDRPAFAAKPERGTSIPHQTVILVLQHDCTFSHMCLGGRSFFGVGSVVST